LEIQDNDGSSGKLNAITYSMYAIVAFPNVTI
jgi:hypothetical protein